MAIIDIFSFCGEMDILEIRLNILYDYVDEFIICESDETFTGLKKPLYFKENMARYEKFLPKIKYFIMASNDPILLLWAKKSPGVPKNFLWWKPENLYWWKREYTQKESMRYSLTHLKDDDLVFIGDVDEIWNPQYIPTERCKLEQTVYSYYLNNRSSEWWEGTSVIPYWMIKKHTLDDLRAHDHHRRSIEKAPTFKNHGWHFTNMGDAEFIKRKLNSYSHQEFNSPKYTDKIEQRIAENKDFIGRNFKFCIDEKGLPKYILDNKDKYKNFFKI